METGRCDMAFIGTGLKLALSLTLPGGLTMDGVDFTTRFYIYQGRSVEIPKSGMTRGDDGTFLCVVDTTPLGSGGELKCQVEVDLPDGIAPGGTRREILTIHTGIHVGDGLRKG